MTRLFGFELSPRDGPELWDELTKRADEAGIRWADLVQDGYRVAGDLYAGGVLIRYDWTWRIEELRRRLGERSLGEGGDSSGTGG